MNNNYSQLSNEGRLLQEKFVLTRQNVDQLVARERAAPKIHISGVGSTISTAYEQLRNAAENTEEHLLLQRTIRRFYKRNLSFFDKNISHDNLGEELIIELTQSGYLKNNTVPKSYLDEIDQIIDHYHNIYWQLHTRRVPVEKAGGWILDILSVYTEAILNKSEVMQSDVFAEFAYSHYYSKFEKAYQGRSEGYGTTLRIALYRALLKSDKATVRAVLIQRETHSFADVKNFIDFQKRVDALYSAKSTERLVSLINKNGAPLRILKRLMDDSPDVVSRLHEKNTFLNSYQMQTEKEYQVVSKKINRGILKSIAFLFITKVIIGLAVEIPYDYYVSGAIIWIPLLVNLLFPPIYMASLKLSMKLPYSANTAALKDYVGDLFFEADTVQHTIAARIKSKDSTVLNAVYTSMFLLVFSSVIMLLIGWGFSWLHIIIFFLFLSTASFLGFRLSRLIRELEMVTTNQGFITIVRDFLYTPFILVGRWMSDKYARVNLIALVLDMAIELPLKTFLRLLRQWTQFLNEKKDNL